jgi:hypothetical protein
MRDAISFGESPLESSAPSAACTSAITRSTSPRPFGVSRTGRLRRSASCSTRVIRPREAAHNLSEPARGDQDRTIELGRSELVRRRRAAQGHENLELGEPEAVPGHLLAQPCAPHTGYGVCSKRKLLQEGET